ncbi:MAG: hypothetical protein OXC81_03330 [Betaproteobacteria bacterium]|nr:hypothetical protein [Betaproteobacteria bacterium]
MNWPTCRVENGCRKTFIYTGLLAQNINVGAGSSVQIVVAAGRTVEKVNRVVPAIQIVVARFVALHHRHELLNSPLGSAGKYDPLYPRHWALRKSNSLAAAALIVAGAERSVRDANGKTPLQMADAKKIVPEVMTALKSANTRPVSKNESG